MHINAGQMGKYELRERLGQGGMAEVWKAFDVRLQRFVAIKFLHSMLRSDPTFISRFLREAQAVASLHHPNIVQIYDFETPALGDETAPAYMVMDYIEGQTLADFLRVTSHSGQFLGNEDLLSLFYSISDAIDYAHRRGLLHRDIKPANILLDRRNTVRNPMGEPVLTDFGIVKMIGTAAGTLTSSSVGTPLYVSPEQAQGHPDTSASDIYSLGVVLYETCTGKLPFYGESSHVILLQHLLAAPPPPEQYNPAISPALSAVLLRCLAKQPEERYPSAMALMASLAATLGLALPVQREMPISAPDIRMLSNSPEYLEQVPTEVLILPTTPMPLVARLETPIPPDPSLANLRFTSRGSPQVSSFALPVAPPPLRQPARPVRQWRVWRTVLVALLFVALVGSGLIVSHAFTQPQTTPVAIVGQVFFISTGDGDGTQNLGINDQVQIKLNNIPAPASGQQYYAWLLPEVSQIESEALALGILHPSGGIATLAYVNPQHNNLVDQFSRFLVTEEPISPAPISSTLDMSKWRYYAEFPPGQFIKNCAGVTVTQLSVLCHLRHLLSDDPDVTHVHLQGGLNYWLLNNVEEIVKWAQEAVDHHGASDVRHKLVNILYVLNGPACILQSLHNAASGADNVTDDPGLENFAALPLLDCSLTPGVPGYVTHIDTHLKALFRSPGVSNNQKKLTLQIAPELNTIVNWLQEVESDTQQLVALNDVQLTQPDAINMRSVLKTLATEVLSGAPDTNTDESDPGVQAITLQIQQLATLEVTAFFTPSATPGT